MCRRRRHERIKVMLFFFCFPFTSLEEALTTQSLILSGIFYNLCQNERKQWEKKVTNLRSKLMKISPSHRLRSRICAFETRFTFLMCIVLVWFLASAEWMASHVQSSHSSWVCFQQNQNLSKLFFVLKPFVGFSLELSIWKCILDEKGIQEYSC